MPGRNPLPSLPKSAADDGAPVVSAGTGGLTPRRSPLLNLARFVRQTVLAAVIMGLSFSSYWAVLKWRGPSAALATRLDGEDAWIAFHPGWVYVYLIPYLIGPPLLGLLRRETFAWYVRRGLLAMAVSLLVFVFLPTKTIRPPPQQVDALGDGLTAEVYRNMVGIDDPPANAAPSLHVSLSCLLAFALIRDFPRWWWAAVAGIGLVWLATLFTWQHHLIDIATGALLAGVLACDWPWKRRRPEARGQFT
jgi:hypothetical protein